MRQRVRFTRGLVVFGVLLVWSGASFPLFRQAAQVPDIALYDSLFFRITWLEDLANKSKAQRQKDDWARSRIRKDFELTEQEEAALKSIALDWREKTAPIVSVAKALAARGAMTDNPQRLADLQAERRQVITDHINQLKAALGPARFQSLDRLLRATSNLTGPGIPTPPR